MKRIRLFRAVFLLWVIVPVVTWLAVALFGLPHVIFSYDWTAPRHASYGDFAARHYTRCTYVGPYGFITEYPRHGRCDWLRFSTKPGGA